MSETTLASSGDVPESSESVASLPEDRIRLTSAVALDEQRAYSITSNAQSRVVVVSGLVGSGKTTLVTSIYERLNSGPVGQLYFAGSNSSHAFEEWCHDGRLASEREAPDTPRTPHTSPGECRFLHLRLAVCADPGSLNTGTGEWAHRDVLFTDLQGEVFERVRDDSGAARRMTVFERADHFVQLVDGDQLRDSATRQGAVADAKNILRSCLAAGVLTRRTVVHVVATKWDLVRAAGKESTVRAFFSNAVSSMSQLLEGHVADVRHHITAARSPASRPIEEWGVLELITDCYFRSHQVALTGALEAIPMTTEFDRFATKVGVE